MYTGDLQAVVDNNHQINFFGKVRDIEPRSADRAVVEG